MKFYLLLVAILAFSTTIDVSEAADEKCHIRTASTPADEEGALTSAVCASGSKCVSYFDDALNNLGQCFADGCAHADLSSRICKDCVGVEGCNKRALIKKCYERTTATTSGEGTPKGCAKTMPTPKCVSYYNADGKNLADCKNTGCTDGTVSSLHCKDCTTDNCNVRSLILRCYKRTTSTTAPEEGTSTACDKTLTNNKCVAYTKDGKNLAKCNDGGCTGITAPDCKECTTDNCNKRALIATTPAPTAAPTAAPGAGATRASVGWLTGIIAASTCVLVLMKPF